ncbi:MarR family winged helix-turn-helix transcriptional regulator [Larkinella sp. VNQ87]|uniref:MarR family winged helix-turn-helix transcriptional regulator n=1 Tax=Larkinella sp. VNQ87 TaxID=3400921 RepID=UPI003C05FC1D
MHYLTENTQTVNPDSPVASPEGKRHEKWNNLLDPANRSLTTMRPEVRLAALVGRLSKYAGFYSKKAMQPFQFRSLDEPVYLLALMQMGNPKKSELIYEMMAEFASGIDVVNRLIGMGFMEEYPDEHDRRSKRLRITQAGLHAIQECLPVMNQIADVAYSSLTDHEKAVMVQILDKLDRYHADHYRESRNAGFDEVYERMVPHGSD